MSQQDTTMDLEPWADLDPATVLSTVGRTVVDARAVLAGGGQHGAASQAFDLLHRVEDLLDRLSASPRYDAGTWVLAVTLRDKLSGYLLAASTLEETGVAAEVIVQLLQRGADEAEASLRQLTATIARS